MRKRLDTVLAERGIFESRSRAAAAVMAGAVRVAGEPARKPGQMVAPDDEITVERGPDYVSRGGTKLANALDALGVPVEGRQALDVGASTGGFTDVLLQRGAAAVMAGAVRVAGEPARKPGQMVGDDDEITIDRGADYVSRGGTKLANALDALGVPVEGRQALDVGASTGGFTDVLLQRGAAAVVALDVAYGELHWRLRQDPRVTVLERTNARSVEADVLPYRPDLIVADVSFISLTKVLPAVLSCAADRFDCLAMVKPQFEAGRERVGKGGVVRDPETRVDTIIGVAQAARAEGWTVMGFAPSDLPGPSGNRETFVWLAEPGRAGAIADVEAAVRTVEP